MFYKNDGTKVELSDYSHGNAIVKELMDKEGMTYRKNNEPVEIEIISSPRIIPASPIEQFYSDGTAQDREVPAGTILKNGKYVISEECFAKNYVPYKDNNGNIKDGLYVEIELVKVIKNPFGKPVAKVNPNNYIIQEGDENCYLVADSIASRYGFKILTSEQLNEWYVPYTTEVKYTL